MTRVAPTGRVGDGVRVEDALRATPLILAGPIVRRVGPEAAHVWMALRYPCSVTMQVYAGDLDAPCARGAANTLALGSRLHVVVVRARGQLSWGTRYSYNLTFAPLADEPASPAGDLFAPGVFSTATSPTTARAHAIAGLTYSGSPHPLPGFSLPPEDLEALRLIHGSCRMPHAEGADALTAVDTMLGAALNEQRSPPHLLILHGDQIYADDVAPAHLAHVSQLARALLGYDPVLPGVKRRASALPPGTRDAVLRDHVGHPEPGGANHVLSLGEFYALYLTTLSDVCWPDEQAMADMGAALGQFRRGLPRVRRALANVATYAVFDDHEVTDDWNLTLHWSRRVLSRAMGRRLVANGLGAFAVFFAWGNTPDRFEPGTVGERVLRALAAWNSEPATTPSATLLGVPDAASIDAQDPPQLLTPPGALDWHFRVEGPAFELVVLDGRTQREFPGDTPTDLPALLSAAATDEQLALAAPAKRATIIVSSSVLLPVPRPWYVRAAQWANYAVSWLRKGMPEHYLSTYGPDRGDKWGIHTPAFDYLLSRMAARDQTSADKTRIVCLCGDVHVGYAARLDYETTDGARTMVLAHLTASGLKRESGATRTQQRLGYGLGRDLRRIAAATKDWRYRAEYLSSGDGIELLGKNHVAELRLTWNEHHRAARHVLWWRRDDDAMFRPHTTFVVDLD